MNLDAGGGAFLRNARASVLEIASGTRTRIKTDYHGLHGFFIFIIRVIRVFRENPCSLAKIYDKIKFLFLLCPCLEV